MTTKISMLAIDLAKGSFQVCAVGPDGAWTPPDCNILGSGSAVTIADVYPASESGPMSPRREPRWISARLLLNAPETSAFAVPVHTSGSRSDGIDPFLHSCQVAAMFG